MPGKFDRDRIILMTKLALYDKRFGKHDKKAACFFRHDYIYLKNMWTRFFVLLGLGIIILLYWVYIVYTSGIESLVGNFYKHLSFAVVVTLVVCLAYTAVGSIKATSEYEKAMKRLSKYNALLQKLDEMSSQPKLPSVESFEERKGSFDSTQRFGKFTD